MSAKEWERKSEGGQAQTVQGLKPSQGVKTASWEEGGALTFLSRSHMVRFTFGNHRPTLSAQPLSLQKESPNSPELAW